GVVLRQRERHSRKRNRHAAGGRGSGTSANADGVWDVSKRHERAAQPWIQHASPDTGANGPLHWRDGIPGQQHLTDRLRSDALRPLHDTREDRATRESGQSTARSEARPRRPATPGPTSMIAFTAILFFCIGLVIGYLCPYEFTINKD